MTAKRPLFGSNSIPKSGWSYMVPPSPPTPDCWHSMSIKGELISLLEEVLPRAEFYARERRFFQPPDSIFLNSEDYRKDYERVKSDALWGRRMPSPSDFMRAIPETDRFPEGQFNRLAALVGQLLKSYTDADNHRFMAVLPSPRV